MIKLYKIIYDQLHYWQTWKRDEKTSIIYWGIVGKLGEYKEIKNGMFTNSNRAIQNEIKKKTKEGFAEFDDNKVSFLEIGYKIGTFGTEKELKKRHRLEEKLNDLLDLTGLGYSSRSSIGGGTMEIKCVVTNYNIAKKVIEEELKNSEFEDYVGIYKKDQQSKETII